MCFDDSPRPGRAPDITPEAKAWLVSQKARDLGYPHELWTTRLLARNAREIKPHKVRYYLERRDEAFEAKMAEVLRVYRDVAVLRERQHPRTDVAIVSYDEKPASRRSTTPRPTCRRGLA